jgi:hypothetical protein
MPGERFEINEFDSALIGRRSGRRVGIGDAISVRVDSIEAARGRVDLVGTDAPEPGGRSPRPKERGRTQGRRRRAAGAKR